MSVPITAEQYQNGIASTGDDKNQAMGLKVISGLVKALGVAPAMAVLTVAWTQGALAILHAESPMPETNIKSLHALIDGMRENVAGHEDCAMRLEQSADGEIIDVVPTTVH